jgi:peptidoglycan L-alanyl-D-glutamate endopeptidase CwlK
MTAQQMVIEIQKALGVPADGVCGPFTIAAIYDKLIGGEQAEPEIDERSARSLIGLHPKVQQLAKEFLGRCKKAGLGVRVIDGLRTYAQQAELYAKGRTLPGKIVTKAGPGQSMHNFGLAFDIGIFVDNKYLPESAQYAAAGAVGKELGLTWGGDFQSIKDEPHFELRPSWSNGMASSAMLAELRRRKEVGTSVI